MEKITVEEHINQELIKPTIKFFTTKRATKIIGILSIVIGCLNSFQEIINLINLIEGGMFLLMSVTETIPEIFVRIIISLLFAISGILLLQKKRFSIKLFNITVLSSIFNLIVFDINAFIYVSEFYFGLKSLEIFIPQLIIAISLLLYFRKKTVLQFLGVLKRPMLKEYFYLSLIGIALNYIPFLILPSMVIR